MPTICLPSPETYPHRMATFDPTSKVSPTDPASSKAIGWDRGIRDGKRRKRPHDDHRTGCCPSEPLLLPDVEETPLAADGLPRFGSSGFYGAADVAAAYCGFKAVPDHLRGYWQHGWTASYRMPIPPDLILGTWAKPDEYYWVARKDEEEHLRSAGFPHVAAIGMPLIYLPPRPIRRRPNSLLVMPAHNLGLRHVLMEV